MRVRGLRESKGLEVRLKDKRFLEREAVVEVEVGDNLTEEEMAPLRAAAAAAEVEVKAVAIIIN